MTTKVERSYGHLNHFVETISVPVHDGRSSKIKAEKLRKLLS